MTGLKKNYFSPSALYIVKRTIMASATRKKGFNHSQQNTSQQWHSISIMDWTSLINNFKNQGLNEKDLVALFCGHTSGFAQCITLRNHIYNETKSIDSNFAKQRQSSCPRTEVIQILHHFIKIHHFSIQSISIIW